MYLPANHQMATLTCNTSTAIHLTGTVLTGEASKYSEVRAQDKSSRHFVIAVKKVHASNCFFDSCREHRGLRNYGQYVRWHFRPSLSRKRLPESKLSFKTFIFLCSRVTNSWIYLYLFKLPHSQPGAMQVSSTGKEYTLHRETRFASGPPAAQSSRTR